MTISISDITINWNGVVTPRTAPNEMRTVADAKSAFNKLFSTNFCAFKILKQKSRTEIAWNYRIDVLGNTNVNRIGTFQPVEESLTEGGPLQGNGGDQEIESNSAVAVLL